MPLPSEQVLDRAALSPGPREMLGLALPRQQVEGLLESPRKPAEALTYGGGGRNRTELEICLENGPYAPFRCDLAQALQEGIRVDIHGKPDVSFGLGHLAEPFPQIG